MKLGYLIGILAFSAWACSPVKDVAKTSATLAQQSQDSTEYEIMIIDPHFDLWYQLNYSEAKDRSQEYYRGKNLVAVSNWNNYARSGSHSEVIDSEINYQPGIDYGVEINRKLYWYFKYVQSNYKVRLF